MNGYVYSNKWGILQMARLSTLLRLSLKIAFFILLFQTLTILIIFMFPSLQKEFIYVNRIFTGRIPYISSDLEPPSNFGYQSIYSNSMPLRIKTKDGMELGAWHITLQNRTLDDSDRLVFMYCHGNAATRALGIRLQLYNGILKSFPGSELLVFDYRGFGDSTGYPSQEGLLNDARAAWRYLTEERSIPSDRIVVIGQSLGTAVASMLASNDYIKPKAFMLMSPIVSISNTVYHYLWARILIIPYLVYLFASCDDFSAFFKNHIQDDFNVKEILKVHGIGSKSLIPVIYIHGTNDRMVPYDHGEQLYYEELNKRQNSKPSKSDNIQFNDEATLVLNRLEKVAFITMKGYGHNDINFAQSVYGAIKLAFDELSQ